MEPSLIYEQIRKAQEKGYNFKTGTFEIPKSLLDSSRTSTDKRELPLDDEFGPGIDQPKVDPMAKIKSFMGGAASFAAPVGAMMQQNSDTLGGSIGGGMLAGLAGGPLGVIAGGLSGGINYAQKQQDFEEKLAEYNKKQMRDKTVEPFSGYFAEGGPAIPGSGAQDIIQLMNIQTEIGEFILTPEGDLVPVMATKLHKDMEKNEITDRIAEGSYIFSQKNEFNADKITDKEDVLFRSAGSYSEKYGNIPGEEFRFTDFVGKGKMSYAEAAKNVSKKISIVNDASGDILTEMTNAKNLETRTPILLKLMAEQEKNRSTKGIKEVKIQSFGDGGFVKKMADGGGIDEPGTITIKDNDKIYDYHIKPDGTILVNKKGSTKYINLDTLPIEKQKEARNTLIQYSNKYPDGGGQELIDRINIQKRIPNTPTDLVPSKGLPASIDFKNKQTIPTSTSNTNQANLPNFSNQSQGILDNLYEKLNINLDQLEQDNKTNLDKEQKGIASLIGGKQVRAGLGLANDILANSLQDTSVDPSYKENTFLKGKYAGTPNSVVEQQAAALRGNNAGLASGLLSSGVNPSDVVSMLSGVQDNSVQAESKLRGDFETQNRNLQRGYYGELNSNLNANNDERARTINAERDNLNKKVNYLKNDVNQYLNNSDQIVDTQYGLSNNAQRTFNTNQNNLFQNRFNTSALQGANQMDNLRSILNDQAAQQALQLNNIGGQPGVPQQQVLNQPIDLNQKIQELLKLTNTQNNNLYTRKYSETQPYN